MIIWIDLWNLKGLPFQDGSHVLAPKEAMYCHPKVIFSHQIRAVSMLRFFFSPGSVNQAVGVQQGWPSAIIALLVDGVKTWG